MKPVQDWVDVHGCQHVFFEGRAGGYTWLLALDKKQGVDLVQNAINAVKQVIGKGTLYLVLYGGLTPLQHAVQTLSPRGVIFVHDVALAGGPALSLPSYTQLAYEDCPAYVEGGDFPEWEAPAHPAIVTIGEFAPAGAVAMLDVPVYVFSESLLASRLAELLEGHLEGD